MAHHLYGRQKTCNFKFRLDAKRWHLGATYGQTHLGSTAFNRTEITGSTGGWVFVAEVIAINDSITNGKQDPALHVTNAKEYRLLRPLLRHAPACKRRWAAQIPLIFRLREWRSRTNDHLDSVVSAVESSRLLYRATTKERHTLHLSSDDLRAAHRKL